MSAGDTSKFHPGEGDWMCPEPQCGNLNFARRNECNRCGTAKKDGSEYKKGGQEIGKNMAEKSKGLFSADDWQCKTCGNVNWARRMTCNMCNAPKYGKVEQRTGYGGGYMERDEVVEYVRRDDSDSEFDEFGRKKKQYRGKGSTEGQEGPSLPDAPKPVAREFDEDEEEEEDDDEDGDLSKYDLDGWGDDDDDEDAKEDNNKKSRSSSRSRSRSRSRSSSSSSRSSSSSSSRSRSRSRSRTKRSRSRSRSRSGSRRVSKRSRSRSRSYERSKRKNRRSRSRSRSPIRRGRRSRSRSRS